MKKLLFFVLLITLKNFGQYKIEYDYVTESFDSFGTSKTISKCYLYTDNVQSKFIKDRVIDGLLEQRLEFPNTEFHEKNKEENERDVYGDSIGYVVTKFLEKDSIYLRTFPGNLIKEKMTNEFTIFEEYKTILNFKCQKATTKIYDREFVVWFTAEIPVNDGPWKFFGLPGLILEAHSKNNYHHFYTTSIKKNLNTEYIYKPVPFKRISSLDEKYNSIKQITERSFKYKKSKRSDVNLKTIIDDLDMPLIVFE